jgi:hypothetical protein
MISDESPSTGCSEAQGVNLKAGAAIGMTSDQSTGCSEAQGVNLKAGAAIGMTSVQSTGCSEAQGAILKVGAEESYADLCSGAENTEVD